MPLHRVEVRGDMSIGCFRTKEPSDANVLAGDMRKNGFDKPREFFTNVRVDYSLLAYRPREHIMVFLASASSPLSPVW